MLFALLVLATGVGLAETQRLKTEPAILDRVRVGGAFTPNGDCQRDKSRISFRLTRGDTVTVSVGRPRGDETVRTLADSRELRSYKQFSFWWDGLNDAGEPAETGPYRARVELAEQDKVLEIGRRIRLHRGKYDPSPRCDKQRRIPPRRTE